MLSKYSVARLGPVFPDSYQVHFFPGPGETMADGTSSVENRLGCWEAARKPLGTWGQGTQVLPYQGWLDSGHRILRGH